MSDRMRDTRQGHIKKEIEGVCVCCRQASLERFIDRCVCRKGVVETLGERPKEKNECARWIECRGRGRGGRVHAREKVRV